MQCRKCGTEIADKAIVCYRCGTSTTDPVRVPAELRRKRNPLFSFVAAALLLLLALYMGQASRTASNPQQWQIVAGILLGVALLLVILRVIRRR
ncbi:MAG: zinc ribbon domain-containing protein [Vicinamibacterales bacterium]